MKKILALALALSLCFSFAGCGTVSKALRYQFGKKGLSPERQAEVDAHLAELRSMLTGKVWHEADDWGEAYVFHEDGSVENIRDSAYSHAIEIRTTEANNWTICFSDQYGGMRIENTLPEDIDAKFDYYLRYQGWRDLREDARIRFDDNGDLWLWNTRYTAGDPVPLQLPEDAEQDASLCACVWHAENSVSVDREWILREDGTGIECSGSLLGTLVDAGGFYWGVKDGILYTNWNWGDPSSCSWTDEYGDEYLRLETFTITEDTEAGQPRYTLRNTWDTEHTVILTPSTEFDLTAN